MHIKFLTVAAQEKWSALTWLILHQNKQFLDKWPKKFLRKNAS